MKKFLAVVLVLSLTLCFTACGENPVEATSSEEVSSEVVVDVDAVKLVVEEAIKATAELDYEKINKYYDEPIITKEVMDTLPENFAESMTLYIGVLKGKNVEVVAGEEENTALATLEITVPNFYELVNSLSSAMYEKMDGMQESDLDLEQIAELQAYSYTLLNDVLQSEDCPTLTVDIELELEMVEGEWKISSYDGLYGALLTDLEMMVGYIAQY